MSTSPRSSSSSRYHEVNKKEVSRNLYDDNIIIVLFDKDTELRAGGTIRPPWHTIVKQLN